MKILVSIFVMTFFFVSCEKDTVKVSNETIVLDYTIGNITTLELSHAFQAGIVYDPAITDLNIEINENLEPHLEVDIVGSTLRIGLSDDINISGNATLRATLTTAELINVIASGASSCTTFDILDQDNFNLVLSGASQYTGNLQLANLNAELSGASQVTISGNVSSAEINLSGASQIGGYFARIENLKTNFSGASSGRLTVNQTLDATLSGASTLEYKGDPQITNQDITGGSNLIDRD
ncbi:MAG: DUF2807 domain-containing protein [Bacteroidia bacterium]|nr:DUF2807 domain-containing protein [Bacteroidia bacterium]